LNSLKTNYTYGQ